MLKIGFISSLTFMLCSCGNPRTLKEEPLESNSAINEVAGNVEDTLDTLSSTISFRANVERISSLLADWGFKNEEELVLRDQVGFNGHWWLKVFKKKSGLDTEDFPASKDWSSLKSITQYRYKKTWEFFIEEWELSNESAAHRWLNIALNTEKLDDLKPPRIYWIEGSRMYFIMATAAQDWFVHSDELIDSLAGRNKSLIHLFNRPINLIEYKKKKRGANSSTLTKVPYYYQPDSVGTYFNYFWFIQLRSRYPAEELFNGLVLKTYIYGSEIGYYEDVVEEFIGLKSKLPDSDLEDLDLVGKDMDYLHSRFGLNPRAMQDYIVEERNGAILIIYLSDRKVLWFNFLQTTLDLKNEVLPKELKYYEELIPKQTTQKQ